MISLPGALPITHVPSRQTNPPPISARRISASTFVTSPHGDAKVDHAAARHELCRIVTNELQRRKQLVAGERPPLLQAVSSFGALMSGARTSRGYTDRCSTSSAAKIPHFADWAVACAGVLDADSPRVCWTSLLRVDDDVLGVVVAVWVPPAPLAAVGANASDPVRGSGGAPRVSVSAAANGASGLVASGGAIEELLAQEFCPLLTRALGRMRAQLQALERDQGEVMRNLQQSFLQRMSHGAPVAERTRAARCGARFCAPPFKPASMHLMRKSAASACHPTWLAPFVPSGLRVPPAAWNPFFLLILLRPLFLPHRTELRSPLNIVIGMLTLCLAEERLSPPSVTGHLVDALSGADALLKLIEKARGSA